MNTLYSDLHEIYTLYILGKFPLPGEFSTYLRLEK